MNRRKRSRRELTGAQLQRLVDGHVSSGSLIPITLPRKVRTSSPVTVPGGARNFAMRGHPRGTTWWGGDRLLTVGNVDAASAQPRGVLGEVSSIGSSSITTTLGTEEFVAGQIVYLQPGAVSDLVENPVGGGTSRVIGGFLVRVAENSTGGFSFETPLSLYDEFPDFWDVGWGFRVLEEEDTVQGVELSGIDFRGARTGTLVALGYVYDLTVDRVSTYGGLTAGLYVSRGANITITNDYGENCGNGTGGTGYTREMQTVSNCNISGRYRNGRYGISFSASMWNVTGHALTSGMSDAAIDTHGGAGDTVYLRAGLLPEANTNVFGSFVARNGNVTWTSPRRRWVFLQVDDPGVFQAQVIAGGHTRIDDQDLLNIQVIGAASDEDAYQDLVIAGGSSGASYIEAVKFSNSPQVAMDATNGFSWTCGRSDRAVVWGETLASGSNIILTGNSTVNLSNAGNTGAFIDVDSGTGITLSLLDLSCTGGNGSNKIYTSPTGSTTIGTWSNVTRNGSPVASGVGADL